jgi:hypothetical protein
VPAPLTHHVTARVERGLLAKEREDRDGHRVSEQELLDALVHVGRALDEHVGRSHALDHVRDEARTQIGRAHV